MSDPPPTPTPAPAAATTPQGYRVELDAYAGPLDLLLYLVKRHEIDLQDIPIATLTAQYLEHLTLMQELQPYVDVDQAGEFLVMAATLVEIKSRMIVPAAPPEEGGEAEGADPTATISEPAEDPRYELVQQLLAYKKYKDAAYALEARHADWLARASATAQPADLPQSDAAPRELDLEDAQALDLCSAFARLLDSVGIKRGPHEVTYDDTPISLHAADIADRLQREGPMSLQDIFVGRSNRSEMIGLFLATLELVRQRKIQVTQDPQLQSIHLALQPEDQWAENQNADAPEAQDEPDWRDPETGEMQYDWPDPEAKQRAERRARIRAARHAQGNFEDLDDPTHDPTQDPTQDDEPDDEQDPV
ncbi:MAG: segregation/condensation protein A [Planctomycetota bacterium]